MKTLALVSLLALGLAPSARAQACRIGSGPDIGDGVPYCSELSPDADTPAQGGQDWSSRWGAIVIDPRAAEGGLGVARAMTTRRAAEAAAMRDCRNTGGKFCRVEVSYDNQCAVLAWGDQYYATANAETLVDAAEMALATCSSHTQNCKVVYSDCSYPARVR